MTTKSKKSESVKVVVRCRPLNKKEISENYESIVKMNVKMGQVEIRNPKSVTEPPRQFTFDSIYDWNSTQSDIFEETFQNLLDSVLSGFNGTIFAYGQTGTGKTFTMEGIKSDPSLRGAIPRSFEHIYKHIARTTDQQYLVRASYLEIYQEKIRDLLSKDQNKRLELRERPDTGVYIKDLLSFVTKSVKEIEHVMNVGNQNRSVGATNMNEHSSRSHAIFVITVECSEDGLDGKNHIRVGKLNLVDLAGSERQSKTGATGERLKEATKINLSLSALGNVISALVGGTGHIPYRDSKLTRLLEDSLGGNAKTVMVANIGPASYNFDETLTTLRYANRAKNIKNKPKINEDPKDALLREFQEEIAKLKMSLEKRGKASSSGRKSKKKTRNMSNAEESDEEIDEEDEISENQRVRLEEDKNRILQDKNIAQEEKEKLLLEKENKLKQLEKEEAKKKELAAKIKAMQSKLLVGGKTIQDHTSEQEKQLEIKRRQLAEERKLERKMQQQLLEREESTNVVHETYSSLRQEVEDKTKKLKKIYAKMLATKTEIDDMRLENTKEREKLELMQLEMTKEFKKNSTIIENFIPTYDLKKIEERLIYNEENESYSIRPIALKSNQARMKRPQSAHASALRPVSQYARMAAAVGFNPRYRGENILVVDLDMPVRTTKDYMGPAVAPKVQAALEAALNEEEDIIVDALSVNKTLNFSSRSKLARSRSSKHGRKGQNSISKNFYPESRGLVPK